MSKLNSSLTAMDWLPQMSVRGAITGGGSAQPNINENERLSSQRIPCGQFDIHAKYDPTISYGKSKPPYSYANIITFAINSSEKGKMTLSEIYQWISESFPYYNESSSGWKNSIRHNLSLNRCFYKVPRTKEDPGKGSYWAINPNPQAEENYSSKQTKPPFEQQQQHGQQPQQPQQLFHREQPHSPQQHEQMSPAMSNASSPAAAAMQTYDATTYSPATSAATTKLQLPPADDKQNPLDNKVFAEHFSLDDLSASFKSLYKTVFQQTNLSKNNNNGGGNMLIPQHRPQQQQQQRHSPTPPQQPQQQRSPQSPPQMNNGHMGFSNGGSLHSSSSLQPSVIAEPSSSMTEKEVLETMESLMASMNSGNWSHIMPHQFYSLIDSLQGLPGLEQNDIDRLEVSYTDYLRFQNFGDKQSSLSPPHRPDNFQYQQPASQAYSTSPRHSPYPSPQAMMPSPQHYSGASRHAMPNPPPSNYQIPHQAPPVFPPNFSTMNGNMLTHHNTYSMSSMMNPQQFNGNSRQRSPQKADIYRQVPVDDEDDDFDWSSIL